jgi:glycosyltransferase involved in cell wall biosynthesis
MVSPHQVKFCRALQKYMDAEFWFYERAAKTRGAWWDIDLGDKCHVLDTIVGTGGGRLSAKYIALGVVDRLKQFDPDIVILGGFSVPSNYVAYRWAVKNKKKTIVFTERSRDSKGNLRKRGLAWALIGFLYQRVDIVMVSSEDIKCQFRDEFRFGNKVVVGRYPSDLDSYFIHPLREEKKGYTYIFPNRLVDIYNPLGAIEIFSRIHKKYPASSLLMNAAGPLRGECEAMIDDLGVRQFVEFLDDISSWDDLGAIYERSDIMLLPATFSNGNYTILEAMASGMGIVISTKVLGIGNYISDGINGYRCEPKVTDFLNRIENYIKEPGLFKAHARLNRDIASPLSIAGTAVDFARFIEKTFGYTIEMSSDDSAVIYGGTS